MEKIIPDEDLSYLDKCKFIVAKLDKVVSEYGDIKAIAIEQPNTSRNMDITRKLCGLYGIVRYMIFFEIPYYFVRNKHETCKESIYG